MARTRRRALLIVAGVFAAALLVTAALFVAGTVYFGRSEPAFPSLIDHPDASLHGTIAYFAGDTGCVRIRAVSGQPAKDVLCLPQPDMTKAAELGTKEDGPQLVWRPDGRLEVTMFRSDPKSGTFSAGWQNVVDIASGQVEDTPAADVPSAPNLATRPTVSPSGQRITTKSDESSGRIKVMLTDDRGTRTLLSARGPGEYTYRLRSAFWSPDYRWIAADDGRILVITTDDPSVTRVLTDDTRSGRDRREGLTGEDPRLASFAVTAADLLPAAAART